MGFQAILASFLQLYFFLIKVFQEFKAGGQIDKSYTLVCRHLSGPFPRRALKYPSTVRWWQSGADRKKGGGQCQGYYYGHLGKPSRQPSNTPRMVAGHMPEACARSIQSPRSQRPHLLKDSSLLLIYLVPRSRLIAPCLQVPSQYRNVNILVYCVSIFSRTYILNFVI